MKYPRPLKYFKNHRAFTLIEVLVVMSILAVLLALSVPAYNSYIYKTKISKVITLWEECKISASNYYLKRGEFNLNTLSCFGGIPEGEANGIILPSKNFKGVGDHTINYVSATSPGVPLKTSTNEPKFYSTVVVPGVPRKDRFLGDDKGELYFGMSVINQEIIFCCGTWDDGDSNVDKEYLPTSCQKQVLNDCFNL